MVIRPGAALIAVVLGEVLAGCGGSESPAHVLPAVGTCVTRWVGANSGGFDVVSCDGPHTHVVSAFVPGADEIGAFDNPCPVASDVPELVGEGVMCFHPVASPSP